MDPTEEVTELISRLGEWAGAGVLDVLDSTVKEVASDYRDKISKGQGASGESLAPLRQSTLNREVRRESSQTIRSALGSVPMSATGATAQSIQATRVSLEEWEISSGTDLGDAILSSNAAKSHTGTPFYGDTNKVVRDPLQVSDVQVDLIEKRLNEDLERLLS